MDFHLEHRLRLNVEPKHKSLYPWAINEVDTKGNQIGDDLIPWKWTLRFTATSCVLSDTLNIRTPFRLQEAPSAPPEIAKRQVIYVTLRPGGPRDEGTYFRETTYSMFGTSRSIKSFQLHIHPVADAAEQENCSAWGCASYTAEIDFTNETSEDCLIFYLSVKPDAFARYAAKVAHGLVDVLILSVGAVDGFYSEWSPSISTRDVKVLTQGDEQKIMLPLGQQFEPPRLGRIENVELSINRRLEFVKRAPELEEADDLGTVLASPETRAPVTDPKTMQVLRSLKRAAWFVVSILAMILIVTLLKQ